MSRSLSCIAFLATLGGSGCATAQGDADAAVTDPDAAPVDAAPIPDAIARPPCVEGDLQAQDPDTGHCYIYIDTNANWTTARAQCEALGGDVHLATIISDTENAFIEALAPEVELWIGGNDLVTEMTFVWITGEIFGYTNWRSGEPNSAAEDCITYQAQLAGVWDDRPCGDNQRIMCERD